MISSGITNDSSIWKLKVVAMRPRQRSMPIANATPSGTAMIVVSAARRRVWKRAVWRLGSCHTESTGSLKYQRHEKPCQELRDRPALKENRTAIATGRIDHTRYSHVKPPRYLGFRHGSRHGRGLGWAARRTGTSASTGATAASLALAAWWPGPCCGRNRPSG